MSSAQDFCNNQELLKTNGALKSACACAEAAKNLSSLVDTYNKNNDQYYKDIESQRRWKAKWDRWYQKTDEYAKWSDIVGDKDYIFIKKLGWSNNCVNRADTEPTNTQCHLEARGGNRYDPEGFYAFEQIQAGPAFGACYNIDVRCKRTDASKQKIDNDYSADQPSADPDTGKVWLGVADPVKGNPPSGNKMVCCAQLFNGITADSVNFKDITQQCGTEINNEIANAVKTNGETNINKNSLTPLGSSSGNTGNSTSNTRVNTSNTNSNSNVPIIIGVFSILVVSSLASSSITALVL